MRDLRLLLKSASVSLVIICLMMMAGSAWAQGSKPNIVCDQPYVLCTSAPCIPDPSDPQSKAICQCDVQVGKSYGNTSCNARKPKTMPDGSKALISTYSFEQAGMIKVMTCPSGKPWTFCLDKPCTVNPMNTKQAICTCDIERKGKFVTFGGSCDTGSCGIGYWSGATVSDYNSASAFLAKELGLPGVPTKMCSK